MAKLVFAPAFWVLARFNFVAAFLLVCALFVLPTLLAVFARDLFTPGQLYAVVIFLTVLAVYLLIALRAFLATGLARIIRITDRIASGELMTQDAMLQAAQTRDANLLWGSIMAMNRSLTGIVTQVRSSAESIVAGSRTISEGNTQLAQRTQEQAASLEQTAGGVEQLAATARQNADSCARANTLAGNSRTVATQAAARVQEAAATMVAIEDSARRVAQILGTVEGIAFQTNILALNAAVEAARAGEQGRGFAVVASEVRALAQRSSAAAREIQSLIGASLSSVDQGRKLVDGVGETMAKVVDSVAEVTDVLATIARASTEQSAGIQEINLAIAQVDTVTQQNAALVEEASGVADAFAQEAGRLLEVVSRFKTDATEERGHAISLVKAAASHLRRQGVQRACADFMDRNGRFVRDGLSIVAVDLQTRVLACATDPSQVGKDQSDQCDADGRFFSRAMVELARKNGSGWYDYRMLDPRGGCVQTRSTYFERVGDVVLECGIDLAEARQAPAPRVAAAATAAGLAKTSWPRLGTA